MLREQLDRRSGLENILSHDYRMLKIFDVVDSVADARASVLITGENGTGKSMIARAIHARSSRRGGPFVEVACGALPDTLLESELFGHVAGAYTGANTGQSRQIPIGRWRHVLPGRNRHCDAGDASQIASRLARVSVRATRRHRHTLGRHTRDSGDQRRSFQSRRGGSVPSGSVLPNQRRQHRLAVTSRKSRRHSVVGRPLSS